MTMKANDKKDMTRLNLHVLVTVLIGLFASTLGHSTKHGHAHHHDKRRLHPPHEHHHHADDHDHRRISETATADMPKRKSCKTAAPEPGQAALLSNIIATRHQAATMAGDGDGGGGLGSFGGARGSSHYPSFARRLQALNERSMKNAHGRMQMSMSDSRPDRGGRRRRFQATILVVYHVIRPDATTIVSNATLYKQQDVLNAAYNNTGFDFVLYDIFRYTNATWYNAEEFTDADREMRARLHRGDLATLNVYIKTSIDSAGSATLPSALRVRDLVYDGIFLDEEYVPDGPIFSGNQGKTLVHEVREMVSFLAADSQRGNRNCPSHLHRETILLDLLVSWITDWTLARSLSHVCE